VDKQTLIVATEVLIFQVAGYILNSDIVHSKVGTGAIF